AAAGGLPRPRAVAAVGDGPAAAAAALRAAVLGTPFALAVPDGRRLPGWIGADDLVIAVSGEREAGTAADCAADAVRRRCTLVAAGRPGGPLQAVAEQGRAPFAAVPGGLWSAAAALFTAVGSAGLKAPGDDVFEAAAARLEAVAVDCGPAVPSWENPAKSLALELAGSLPAVLAAPGPAGVAADRFAAGASGYPVLRLGLDRSAATLPALLAGPFGPDTGSGPGPGSVFHDPYEDAAAAPPLRLVSFRDPGAEPEWAERALAAAHSAAEASGTAVSTRSAQSGHPLERAAGLIAMTDYASVYLTAAYAG
ncbi:SIS domain-containing protein, partial [Nocardiopsis coralliicola]